MSREQDLKFLKDLQSELKTQEVDSQAAPRFWVLRDYKWVLVPEGYGTEKRIYDREDEHTVEEFKRIIKESYEEDMLSDGFVDSIDYAEDESILVDLVNTYMDSCEFELFDVVRESFIVQDTMFLTKQEAKDHIQANHYHYSDKVHTYAMTAWRAPKVQKLLEILESFDFDEVQNG